MASIDEFMRSGRLGPITGGMSQDEVRGLLGEPEDVSVQKNPEIWKYGALQLGFYRSPYVEKPVLTTINLYFHDPTSSLPDRLGLTGWQPTSETTIEAFRDYIPGYDPQVYGEASSFQDVIVTTHSGVRITFGEGHLYGIHFQSKKESAGKQFTIFLPKDLLDAIRKEASEQRISVSDLCARWIREKAESLQKTGVR
jgi:hypothetical protein